MSDRVSGHPRRRQPAGRAAQLLLVLALLGLIAGPAAQHAAAAGGLTVTTPFPAVVVEPGTTASFDLAVDVASARRVELQAGGVPDGWTASFQGGGLVIDGVWAEPGDAPEVTLAVDVPDDAAAGTTTITVDATAPGSSDTLTLSLRVAEDAGGEVTLESDFPELRGPSSGSFTFNLTLRNDTAADGTFSMNAVGPDGWTVRAEPTSQSQATSTAVDAGASTSIKVTAEPPSSVEAGSYPIQVTVSGAGKTATTDLQVVITGTYTLTVSTSNQVLSTTANAGSPTTVELAITNDGTAPVTDVRLSATDPTDWDTTFEPETVAAIGPGETATVSAQITPTNAALAGDYEVTITGTGAEANDSVTIRVRVETPQFWWIVGIVLIGATFAGLYWVFRTYGRR